MGSLAGEAQIQHLFKLIFEDFFFFIAGNNNANNNLGNLCQERVLDNLNTKTSRQEVLLGFVHLTRPYRSLGISFFLLNAVYGGIHSSRQMLLNSPFHNFEGAFPEDPEFQRNLEMIERASWDLRIHTRKLSPVCFFYSIFF